MLTLDRLTQAVREDAAIRRVRRLQPVGGPGDKIFPPTFSGAKHAFENRWVQESSPDGKASLVEKLCVHIDTVQSQANRFEEELRDGRGRDFPFVPALSVDFTVFDDLTDLGVVTSFDAPHRMFDAIFRDCLLNGVPLDESDYGQRFLTVKPANATLLYELSPNSLLLGSWYSTKIGGSEGGGLGARFPRSFVSEIMGIDVAQEMSLRTVGTSVIPELTPSGKRIGSRIDPFNIAKNVPIYRKSGSKLDWTPFEAEAVKEKGKPVRFKRKKDKEAGIPAVINHGNIPPTVKTHGVSVKFCEQSTTLSFSALRRFRFPSANGQSNRDRDSAGQTVLAALGLVAAATPTGSGGFLRSRCDLVPETTGRTPFELLSYERKTEPHEIEFAHACRLLTEAIQAAEDVGLSWRSSDLDLAPQPKLLEIIRATRRLADLGEAETEKGGGASSDDDGASDDND